MNPNITRRSFLGQGVKGLAAAVFIPPFFHPGRAFALSKGEKQANYYEYFGVTEEMLRAVMQAALAKGGDYCDLYFQHRIVNQISLEDNSVNRAHGNISFGVGIRVLKGDQTGYSFTEEITLKAMKLAAATAANIATAGKKVDPVPLSLHKTPDYYKIKTPWEDVGIDQKIPCLKNLNSRVFALDSRIIKSNIFFVDESSHILFANSEGRVTWDYQPMITIGVSCIAEENKKREQNFASLSGRQGMDLLTPENMEYLADKAVKKTTELFEAVKLEGGQMEVVLAPGNSGILLHEAIGHGMEADFNRKNISIFSDKMNKPVAKKFVTIVDSGVNPHCRGTINIDDEGNDVQETVLVEEGILKNYLHDRISAQHYNVEPTGNGRRQSFRHPVLPRMRNTYMLPGPHKREEIIASVKKGIYAETFINGQVFIGGGDFTFYVKSGYLIENGKFTKPVKDVNIIGNGPEVLKNIVMVGNDLKMHEGGGSCGKNGQTVPVSMGLPTVKVSQITVGGVSV